MINVLPPAFLHRIKTQLKNETDDFIRAMNEPGILCGVALTPIVRFPSYAEYSAAQSPPQCTGNL